VVPSDPGYWPPADRDLVLTLDDLLLEPMPTDGPLTVTADQTFATSPTRRW
jgi:hypothetical protein